MILIEDLLEIQLCSDAQISPDGSRVLFLRKRIDDRNRYLTSLGMVAAEVGGSPEVKAWTQEEEGLGQARWSPDGSQIAFVSRRSGGRPQLHVMGGGGEARQVSVFPEGSLGAYRWSPDGRSIAVTFRRELPERTKAAVEERKLRGGSTPPFATDKGWHRLDGDGYFGEERFAIYRIDVASGATAPIYSGSEQGLYQFDWMPDSRGLIVAHSVQPNPWAMTIDERLFHLDLGSAEGANPAVAREIPGAPKGRKIAVSVSPDGRFVAYLGHDASDDFWGVMNNQLYLVPLTVGGGPSRCLSEKHDLCLSFTGISDTRDAPSGAFLRWTPDSRKILLNWSEKGGTCVGAYDLDKGDLVRHWQGNATVIAASVSRDGLRLGCSIDDGVSPPEVAVIDLAAARPEPRRLTGLNASFKKTRQPIEPEELWLKASDGHPVHAWVLRPRGAPKSSTKGPAVLAVHGGPHMQYGWGYFHEFQCLASQGITVVYGNPRGSKGYGQAHCSAIRGSWGDRDWEDVQAITAWMKSQTGIDPARIGIMGGSYGGYMTNWAISHSDGYRAAITDRCVSNLVSMCGTSDYFINKDMLWPGSPTGGLESIATLWKQSPLAYFDRVKTPTLVIHAEGDLRCNIEQGEQVFAALQIHGVESRLVRYPRECSHGMSRSGPPDLRIHRLREIAGWLTKYLA